MHKILVEIYHPASNQTYDVFIPLKSKMYEVTILLANSISELSKGNYKASPQSVLCDRHSGKIYDRDARVEELGLKNGAKMMLL